MTSSDNHDVPLVVVPVRQPLIPDLDLGEVKAAGLGAWPAAGDRADGQAVPEERAVDLPSPEARTQTPNMLESCFFIFKCSFVSNRFQVRTPSPLKRFIDMGYPRPLFLLFSYFQANITFFTTNIREKISIQYTVLGFEPTTFRYESPPITTRPYQIVKNILSINLF